MKDLKTCRIEIDDIDSQIAILFERRMAIARDVVLYKKANNLPIFQPEREQEVLQKNVDRIVNDDLKGYAKTFFQDVMDTSKSYQSSFLDTKNRYPSISGKKEDILVGFQGVPGSFSNLALNKYFGDVNTKNFPSFEEVYQSLLNDEIDYGIVPLENSSTGAINDNYDLVREYHCSIIGEISIPIAHHLLAKTGTKLEDIKEVYSHPQGILQCSHFLKAHSIVSHDYYNTAMAAKFVSESSDHTIGAIASTQAASIYGLDVVAADVHNQQSNETRFIIVSKSLQYDENSNRISLIVTLGHKPGALYSILKTIKEHHINLTRIESRPIVDTDWQYYFYIDFEGNLEQKNIMQALEKLKAHCLTFEVLGNYSIR